MRKHFYDIGAKVEHSAGRLVMDDIVPPMRIRELNKSAPVLKSRVCGGKHATLCTIKVRFGIIEFRYRHRSTPDSGREHPRQIGSGMFQRRFIVKTRRKLPCFHRELRMVKIIVIVDIIIFVAQE